MEERKEEEKTPDIHVSETKEHQEEEEAERDDDGSAIERNQTGMFIALSFKINFTPCPFSFIIIFFLHSTYVIIICDYYKYGYSSTIVHVIGII